MSVGPIKVKMWDYSIYICVHACVCVHAHQCYIVTGFIVDLARNQASVEMFRTHGIGVMTVTAFLQTVAHKPPAVVLPMPEPSKCFSSIMNGNSCNC